MYVSTEDSSPLPVKGFSLKGDRSTSDLMSSFAGGEEAARGGGDGKVRGSRGRGRGNTGSFQKC